MCNQETKVARSQMSEDVGKGQSGQAAGLVEATRRVTLAGWSKLLEGQPWQEDW